MQQKNNDQNSVIFQIDEILNKMSNQVNFLIRNNKLMNQLDVDLLMENTRKLYDTLCSVKCNMDVDSIPMEIEEVEEEFGNSEIQEEEEFRNSGIQEEIDDEEEIEDVFESSEIEEEYEEFESDFEDDIEEDLEEEEFGDSGVQDEEEIEDEEGEDEFRDSGIQGEEEIEEEKEEEQEEEQQQEQEEQEQQQEQEDSGIRAYKKVYTIDAQTLGDKLESAADTSLAARLQRKPVADLAAAIGINDKFLLLNELFGGSMEKYNKSIRALNNFSTLLGAKTYMSELQIEFQWDCESDAYRKLDDLVERRFM
jgi:DNA polymerase III alpha subunit (gram-positive type)